MTDKTLLTEYKSTIADLTKEKKELNETITQKDSKIKQILIQLEQANADVQSMGSKIGDLQDKLNKKQTIKLNIDKKIEEILENKIEPSVDNDDEV
jgi:chromosome segregation ATPase|tara:strand:- start:235 stop:522 length:288 start_codon:yes stop_codon:yes gene_type:complete